MLYLYIFIDDICICTYWQTCLAPFQTPQKHAEEEQTSSSAAATPGSSTSSASVGQLPPQFPNVSSAAAAAAHQAADYEAEEEAGLELPPPMKPIQEPHLIANGPPAFPKDLKESSANMVSVREGIPPGNIYFRQGHLKRSEHIYLFRRRIRIEFYSPHIIDMFASLW